MSVWISRIARMAAQRIASDPQARAKAVEVARVVAQETKLIVKDEDRARAAGRSFRRALNKLRDDKSEK